MKVRIIELSNSYPLYSVCIKTAIMLHPIEIEKAFGVSIDKLWYALTDNESMKKWYFDFSGNFKAEVGHKVEWHAGPPDGKQWRHKAEILEIVDKRRIKHSWEYPGYDGYSELTWKIIPLSTDRTKLKMRHEIIEPFDKNEEALRRENFVEGWNFIINNSLTDFLKNDKD